MFLNAAMLLWFLEQCPFSSARDESIKKLLEMLQSKGLSSRATEEDHERTRRLADAEMTIHQLEGLLERKDKEMLQLREVCVRVSRRKTSPCVCVCVLASTLALLLLPCNLLLLFFLNRNLEGKKQTHI